MSALLTMNFRINSGHTTGGEDMRLSVGKRVIPVFVVVAVLIFSTIGLAHMKTELIQQQRVSVQTATCLMKMSLVRAQESAEIDEVHTRRISRLIFLERSREFRDGNMRLHMLFFLSAIWCGCFCFFERNVRSIHEHCSRKRNLVIAYIHSQDGQKHRRLAFSI